MSTRRIEAAYLPGLSAQEVQWHVQTYARDGQTLEVALPVLSAAQMSALALRVRQASARHLKTMTVSEIITVIDRAVARLLDAADPLRQQADALLPWVTGYDANMVRLGLTGLLKTFRAPQLHRFVAEDFANPKVLDGFQPATKGGAVRAYGPGLLVHSWAGNVPALALWSLVCGLLVKAGNIGKLPSAEPLFAGWFARLLADVHPPWADCLAVVWWRGAGGDEASALYAQADTVVAYGGNEALQAIRQRLPVSTRLLAHGHKLGFGVISAAALDTLKGPALARRAAWDVMRYDQQGCYSPHIFYVQRGGPLPPQAFASYLAGELANLQNRYPRHRLDLQESAALAKWRQSIEWRQTAGRPADILIGDPDDAWSVVYTDYAQDLAPTALQRSIVVAAIDSLDDVAPAVAKHAAYLQTAGVAATPEELYQLADQLGAAGVTRISALGAMSQPEAGWHNDGRFNLLDLVRMSEIEHSAEAAADAYAPYEP
ncbi:acyl-CoA reductase [Bordetella avium]|uniref:Acyl-CoA reductase n=1 Tax=Bordetella avium (strain 197N) TaxID=360910 RepID=Q2KXJ3_BORA1|nr:acyl-CoA reductase [Bordetella avium]RIQ13555.1 acyl-CoA reductase [Bordetella avium]RIQ16491.1 acyl-CoA reductase [Bordetella avium]RIQ31249.1 acyl-CoA reductase [Bordetella avium]RIQ36902.1 acyl-CoA reductase [Bordetella avium]RIQ40633.1 acyl-CoA reductase [Bordetella avium]